MPVRQSFPSDLGRLVVAALLALPQLTAQANPPPSLKFEVASVKVAASGRNGVNGGCRGIDSVFSAEEQKACREKLWAPNLFQKTWDHYRAKLG